MTKIPRSANQRVVSHEFYVLEEAAAAIGKILDVMLNSLLVGWALFFIIKAINRTERIASSGVEQLRGQPAENSDS